MSNFIDGWPLGQCGSGPSGAEGPINGFLGRRQQALRRVRKSPARLKRPTPSGAGRKRPLAVQAGTRRKARGWGVDVDSPQKGNLGGAIPIPNCRIPFLKYASPNFVISALRTCAIRCFGAGGFPRFSGKSTVQTAPPGRRLREHLRRHRWRGRED